MGYDDVVSALSGTSFHRLTGCQWDPRDRGVTFIIFKTVKVILNSKLE